jgi:hypothetical protein
LQKKEAFAKRKPDRKGMKDIGNQKGGIKNPLASKVFSNEIAKHVSWFV